MKRKVQPVQHKIKREISVDAENEVKKEDSKFQPMLIQRDLDVLRELGFDSREAVEISRLIKQEPIGGEDDFKPKMELKKGIEETLNLEIHSAPEANGDMYAKSHRGRFKCWKCGRRFRTKKLFDLHNGVPKIFKCDFTPSESYMKRHSKFHVGNNLEKDIPKRQKDENSNGNEGYGHFKCTMCGANFKRKSELDIHVTASHGGTAIY